MGSAGSVSGNARLKLRGRGDEVMLGPGDNERRLDC